MGSTLQTESLVKNEISKSAYVLNILQAGGQRVQAFVTRIGIASHWFADLDCLPSRIIVSSPLDEVLCSVLTLHL